MCPSSPTERAHGQQRERSKEIHRDTQRCGARAAHRPYPSGKHAARKLLKARILLKADASQGGEGWSDSQIAAALRTSVDTVSRTRQRLVEEGVEAALIRKHSPNSARRRIFDGAAEARLIALACSKPPAGRARWTLQLLEEAVVELKIVERASDNTIGRMLKKTLSSRI
jgi:Homeodomain-like domain